MLALTNEWTRAGNALKSMHIEYSSLPLTLSDTRKQELDEKKCVL